MLTWGRHSRSGGSLSSLHCCQAAPARVCAATLQQVCLSKTSVEGNDNNTLNHRPRYHLCCWSWGTTDTCAREGRSRSPATAQRQPAWLAPPPAQSVRSVAEWGAGMEAHQTCSSAPEWTGADPCHLSLPLRIRLASTFRESSGAWHLRKMQGCCSLPTHCSEQQQR